MRAQRFFSTKYCSVVALPVVHFLRPLLERHLDAERLVDRERDVEEVEAVDAEIVDGVAFRLDRLARNIAGLGR